jgi:hypothetical protein
MQIKEILELKMQAERDILMIINSFTKTTGLNISGCGLSYNQRLGYKQEDVVGCSLEVKIA